MIEIKPSQIEHAEIETDTWAFNDSAQAFFKQFGFQPKIIRQQLDINSNKKESLNNPLQPTA